ncbi:MAG: penicillin-binding protein 1C [Roseinatronobacter sp.]
MSSLVSGLVLGLWGAGTIWVARTELPPLWPETSVEVLARDGTLLRAFTVADGRWRLGVDLARVDPTYLAMLIAQEDRRFHRHRGVDVLALGRAAGQAVTQGRVVSGGSTLTMQVARLIEDGPTGTWHGKLRQIRLALALERVLPKDGILALYLHHAPMGGNLEGLRAGALAWLGREPDRLTEAQAALLIALPQAPALRAPDRHPERATAARDRVLRRAALVGVIPPEALEAALAEPIPQARRAFPAHAPHLADRLRAADPARRIHRTTLDAQLQAALEDLARRALPGLPAQATVALMLADPQTGSILASVGSAAYLDTRRQGFVDMTQALRSPGSVLKPLVYGLAFSDGLVHPETLLNDRPAQFGGYAPQNFDGQFRGPVSAREALQLSLNLPVVALTEALGPARLMAALRQAGLRAEVPDGMPGLAISLGGVGVSLEGLVQLYAALARGGEAVALSVRDPVPKADAGPASASDRGARARLISAEAAWHLGDVLADAPRPARLPGWRLAFKTGTSYGHRDALALGYDGAHVAGVWVGRADGAPVPGMFGVDAAAPILFEIFGQLRGAPLPLPPAPPATRVVAHADLPPPLQHFGARLAERTAAPELAFPPSGAALHVTGGRLPARVERGRAPFTWFANGVPVLVGSHDRAADLPVTGPGFVTLSVVDADGQGARVSLELR